MHGPKGLAHLARLLRITAATAKEIAAINQRDSAEVGVIADHLEESDEVVNQLLGSYVTATILKSPD